MKHLTPINTLTTAHNINYKGYGVVIKGAHELKFAPKSKMRYFAHIGNMGVSVNKFGQLAERLDYLISELAKQAKRAEFYAYFKSLSTLEKIAHSNFAYSRFQPHTNGNYYNIYWKSSDSPTGVELVGGCSESEWELYSNKTNNTNNYLSPTESRMSAR